MADDAELGCVIRTALDAADALPTRHYEPLKSQAI
jgi:hypothetical protein